MTAKLRAQLAAKGVNLPILVDYTKVRATFPAGADKRLEAHRWAIANLLPW